MHFSTKPITEAISKILKTAFCCFAFAGLQNCTSRPNKPQSNAYQSVIFSVGLDKTVHEKNLPFSAENDTLAFLKSFDQYWIEKLATKELNIKFKGSGADLIPIPFRFIVKDPSGKIIDFGAETAERITASRLADFKKRYADLDTITPLNEREALRTPEIY